MLSLAILVLSLLSLCLGSYEVALTLAIVAAVDGVITVITNISRENVFGVILGIVEGVITLINL